MQKDNGDLGRFGSAEEFNRFPVAPPLVNHEVRLGVRPTFSTDLNNGFFAGVNPALSTIIVNGFDWFTEAPDEGRSVYVPGSRPVNIIMSLPYILETPVPLSPVFQGRLTRDEWVRAGIDPDKQGPLWTMPNSDCPVIMGPFFYSVRKGRYTDRPPGFTWMGEQAGWPFPYTQGVEVPNRVDFAGFSGGFTCLAGRGGVLPAGRYRFRMELFVIPRELAYTSTGEPEVSVASYVNKNLGSLTDVVKTEWTLTGVIPEDLRTPAVLAMTPTAGPTGTLVRFQGNNLASTDEIAFERGVPGLHLKAGDTEATAQVPPGAHSGQVVVKTRRGWVRTDSTFDVSRDSRWGMDTQDW